MKSIPVCAAAALMCLGLTGCNKLPFFKPKAPTGQVVATVGNQEITLRELQAELSGVKVTDPKQQRLAQDRALELIVLRKLMANAARQQGIDKTPDFALLEQRAIDEMLAEALEAKTVKAVPPPSPEEVSRYITDHPNSFADRRIYDIDQIRFPRPNDTSLIQGLEPLHTMPDIANYLTAHHIAFQEGTGALDALSLDPRVADAIAKAPNEPFMIGAGDVLLVGQIKDAKQAPVSNADATKLATAILTRQHNQEAAQREVAAVMNAGKGTVHYNPAYQPPPPPKAAPAAASNATGGLS